MRIEMSKAEAITRIDRFLAYLEKIYTPQCDYDEALIRKDDITAFVIARDALKEQRPHGEWKTESAIDYLTEIGWLPEHDRILTETRPHGEWKYAIVDCYKSGYICPHCNGFAVIEGKSDGYSVTFCPNCGSRNQTEEGDENE